MQLSKSKSKTSTLVTLLLAIGIFYRIYGYGDSAIWFDEAMSVYRAKLPLFKMLAERSEFSGNLLWEMAIRPFVMISDSVWVFRIPALVFGCAGLFVAWKIMVALDFSSAEKSFSMALIAFTPSMIWMSQDARQYSLLTFLYLLSCYFALKANWLAFFAASALTCFTHFVGPAYAVGAGILALYCFPKAWKKIVFATTGAILCWAPWLIYRVKLIPFGDALVPEFNYWRLVRAFVDAVSMLNLKTELAQAFLLIFILGISIVVSVSLMKRRYIPTLILFLGPLLILIIVSVVIRNVIVYRTLMPLVIPFLLWTGVTLADNRSIRPRAIGHVFVIVWCVLLVMGILKWNPNTRGGYIDRAATYIRQNWSPGDIIFYGTATTAMPFDYYLNDKPHFLMDGNMNVNLTPEHMTIYHFASLENLDYQRAWVIYPLDGYMEENQLQRLERYTLGGYLITTIQAPQFANIFVYLVDKPGAKRP